MPLVVCEPLLPGRFAQLGAESQLQDFLGRELHPVHVRCVLLHLSDELPLVVGLDLEPAIAAEYLHRRALTGSPTT